MVFGEQKNIVKVCDPTLLASQYMLIDWWCTSSIDFHQVWLNIHSVFFIPPITCELCIIKPCKKTPKNRKVKGVKGNEFSSNSPFSTVSGLVLEGFSNFFPVWPGLAAVVETARNAPGVEHGFHGVSACEIGMVMEPLDVTCKIWMFTGLTSNLSNERGDF